MVRKADRKQSTMQFFKTALRIRYRMSIFIQTDFYSKKNKKKIRELNFNENLTEEQVDYINELMKVNDYIYEEETKLNPDEFIMNKCKEELWAACSNLMHNIIQANTIYITGELTYAERLKYQNSAIANCFEILNTLQLLVAIYPHIKINLIVDYVKDLDEEIKCLKGWKKRSKKDLKAALKKIGEEKISKVESVFDANVANANNNGNANCNTVTNANYVAPIANH